MGVRVPFAFRFWVSRMPLDLLGEPGFDPVYGARPLQRAIESRLGNTLAQKILGGECGPEIR